MFTDRDLVLMIDLAKELRASIRNDQKEKDAGNVTNFQIDLSSVEDLCELVLELNEESED